MAHALPGDSGELSEQAVGLRMLLSRRRGGMSQMNKKDFRTRPCHIAQAALELPAFLP